MELNEARTTAAEYQEMLKEGKGLGQCLWPYLAVVTLNNRITELEAVLRELLRHGEFPGTITRNNLEARRNALKVLAKGE